MRNGDYTMVSRSCIMQGSLYKALQNYVQSDESLDYHHVVQSPTASMSNLRHVPHIMLFFKTNFYLICVNFIFEIK